VDSELDHDADLPRPVDLHLRIRSIVTGVVLARVTALGSLVVLSVVSLARVHRYTEPPLAAAVYLVVAAWGAAGLRHRALPGRQLRLRATCHPLQLRRQRAVELLIGTELRS
jgi:hypothetical protein